MAWSAADQLLVLAAEGPEGGGIPYSLGVDGSDLTAVSTAGLPGQPTSIAAAPAPHKCSEGEAAEVTA